MKLIIFILFIGTSIKSYSNILVDLEKDSVVIIPQQLKYKFLLFKQNYPYNKYNVVFKNDTIISDNSIYVLSTNSSNFAIQICDSTNKIIKKIQINTYQTTPKIFFVFTNDSLSVSTKLVELKIEKINYNIDIVPDTLQSYFLEIYNKKGIVYTAQKSELLLTEGESKLFLKYYKKGVILIRNLKINDRFGNNKHYWVNEVK